MCAGSADLCFVTDVDVRIVRRGWVREGVVEVLRLGEEEEEDGDGCVVRTGARGRLRSFYCRDLDGNLIEWVFFPS